MDKSELEIWLLEPTADDVEEESDAAEALWKVPTERSVSWTCMFSSTVVISTNCKTQDLLEPFLLRLD